MANKDLRINNDDNEKFLALYKGNVVVDTNEAAKFE